MSIREYVTPPNTLKWEGFAHQARRSPTPDGLNPHFLALSIIPSNSDLGSKVEEVFNGFPRREKKLELAK